MIKSWRTKKKIKKLNPKNGFLRAKHGLRRDRGFKTKFGLQREKENREGQEKGEKKRKRKRKRREEEEEEEKKKRREGKEDQRYGN